MAPNRRLPRPQGAGRKVRWRPWPEPDVDHPGLAGAVAAIERVCRLTRLSPWPVWKDWAGMLEASLVYQAANTKALARTGRFIEDPPAVQAHYKKARERYLRAARQYPAAYRAMQDGFTQVSAMLSLAAEPGLVVYGAQPDLNPDVIGQIFIRLLMPGPVWRQYFPPWRVALAAAAAHLPDRAAVQTAVIETVVDAGSRLARAQPGSLKLEPGENWLEYLTAVEPYIEPLVIGPEIIDSSVEMLALATRFPPWAVQSGVVRFVWDGADPLLAQMARINSCLYGLNGYTLELARAAEEIGTELAREPMAPALPFRPDEAAIEPPLTGPTFQELFRKEAP